ncbi:MAG: membrane dipeptidase, partial [Acetobacteraceae bacterium]|nr:membrane dipeptidase [Acetobacteraceae bacterium]
VRLVGIDYVGLGTDWTWGNPPDPSNAASPDPAKSFKYPPDMNYNQPNGLEYVQNFKQVSDLPFLVSELIRHGYSYVDIKKIMGGNWMRVFSQAWNA